MKILFLCTLFVTLLTSSTTEGAASVIEWRLGGTYESMTVGIGDILTFQWEGTHNVFINPSGTCDETDATLVGDSDGSADYTFTCDDVNKSLFFACNIGSHCESGQNILVQVQNVGLPGTEGVPCEVETPLEVEENIGHETQDGTANDGDGSAAGTGDDGDGNDTAVSTGDDGDGDDTGEGTLDGGDDTEEGTGEDDDEEGDGNVNQEIGSLTCDAIGDNEISCLEAEPCHWCQGDKTCRDSIDKCPGFPTIEVVCGVILDQENCTEATEGGIECVWCEQVELCRTSELACPGNGRGNVCRNLMDEDNCTDTGVCDWLDESSMCRPLRGSPGNTTETDRLPRGPEICSTLTSEGNCTEQVFCRWCNDTCARASEFCSDGTAGVRGNPCDGVDTEDACNAIGGCVFCALEDGATCSQATFNACEVLENVTDSCPMFDAEPECNEEEDCQWCSAQMRCRSVNVSCAEPVGFSDLEFGEDMGGVFRVQDLGLGPTDPNTVTVAIRYLYEVTEEGTTLEASLIDLENLDYEISQSVEEVFPGIIAQKVNFLATIDGVGTVQMDVYMMMNSGIISTANNLGGWEVREGDVKFNVELKDWVFCGDGTTCGDTDEKSQFLDIAFQIQGNAPTPEQSESNALLFNLGGNVPLFLSNQVIVDGFPQNLPEGFPRVESTEEEGTLFVFRFPSFEESVIYDPIVAFSFSIPVIEITPAPTSAPDPTESPTSAPSLAPTREEVDDEDDGGLSGGAIAGIVIGLLLLAGAGAGGMMYMKRRQAAPTGDGSDDKAMLGPDGDDNFHDEETPDDEDDEESGDDEDDDDDEEESGSEESGEEESGSEEESDDESEESFEDEK